MTATAHPTDPPVVHRKCDTSVDKIAVMGTNERSTRRGRPPRIDRDSIIEAVLTIGAAKVTMRGVAEYLGVSLPGLYHHIKNQDELLRLAAEAALVKSPPPRYDDMHWATWLRSYASYIRSVLAAEPALVEKFVSGAVPIDGEIEYTGNALEALRSHGLAPAEAITAWSAVTALAIGSVSEEHREHLHARDRQPWQARVVALIARSDASRFPALRALADSGYQPFVEEAFQQRMTLLLNGIATTYGLSAEPDGR